MLVSVPLTPTPEMAQLLGLFPHVGKEGPLGISPDVAGVDGEEEEELFGELLSEPPGERE